MRESVTSHGMIMLQRKSSRTMTILSEGECHNYTMKRVGCNPHIMTSIAMTVMWIPSGHTTIKIDKFHDATEEDCAPSITSYKVGIEIKMRHKQYRDNE